jgi:hypothetical protein
MLRQVNRRGQKTHPKAACIVKTQFKIGAELEDQMIVRRIVLGRRAGPETTGHAKMQQQHVFWMEIHEEVFGASLNTLDRTADGVFLQGRGINDVPQPWLPNAYTSDLVAD